MIDTLNANINVGIVWIILNSSNKWNNEIVRLMINRYTNVIIELVMLRMVIESRR